MKFAVMLRLLASYLVRPVQQELSIALRISKQISPCDILPEVWVRPREKFV